MKVLSVTARVICHATEDERKVLKALENILGGIEGGSLKREGLSGHYGDPIVLLTLELKDENRTRTVLENLKKGLSIAEKLMLASEAFEEKGQEGVLYIRLDKQSAYLGRLKLSERDAVRLELRIVGSLDDLRHEMGV
ncbi:MAG: RNA-binding domain-containing protein [Nitrososphaerota archaeon]